MGDPCGYNSIVRSLAVFTIYIFISSVINIITLKIVFKRVKKEPNRENVAYVNFESQ